MAAGSIETGPYQLPTLTLLGQHHSLGIAHARDADNSTKGDEQRRYAHTQMEAFKRGVLGGGGDGARL